MSDPRFNPNPSFGFPTPPGSPRKRRNDLRESEESEGEMSLEQYLLSCDPYRSTNLPNMWPYPLMLTDSPELRTTLLAIHDDIRAVLRRHGFPEHIWFVPYVANKPYYPGGDTAVNLLRVILQAADNHPRRLGPAKDDIARLLNAKGITDMFVEIVNLELCFLPSFFPMSPDHSLVVGFEAGRQRILDLIQATLGRNWRLLCPFNVGRSEAKARPAIVIIVNPMTRANWSGLQTRIKSLLARHCQFQTVEVEFLPGDLSLLNGVSFAGKTVPAMGSSVGINGDSNSGTLGGYVTLTQGNKVLKGFLTNYHVVRPLNPKSGFDENLANLDRFGSSRPMEKTIEIESFSRLDTQATLSDLDGQIRNTEQDIDAMSARAREREEMGCSATNLRNMVNQYQSLVSNLHQQRQHVAQMPIVMGKVTATSGKAILGRRFMDWAFVEMNDTAIKTFFRPNYMFPVPPDQRPNKYKAEVYAFAKPVGQPLWEFGRLVKGDVYTKLGRTTGVTTGVCHGAMASCQWEGKKAPRYDHNGREYDVPVLDTEEYVILSKKRNAAEYQQAPFADDGDSGSLVIDQEGRVCGLLYGGTTNCSGPPGDPSFHAMAGLVTDIRDLSQSVKLRTLPKDEKGNVTGAPAELGLPEPDEGQA